MNPTVDTFEQLAFVEKSFRVDGPWTGRFDLDGYGTRCTQETHGWLRLSTHLTGDARNLIRRQGSLLLPVKFADGPDLVAEMPLTQSLTTTFAFLRAASHQALMRPESSPVEDSLGQPVDPDITEQVYSTLEEMPCIWTRADTIASTEVGTTSVVAHVVGTAVIFRASLVRRTPTTGLCLDALTHFLLAINARLRFARATFAPAGLVQEVALPVAVLTPAVASCAVWAVSNGLLKTKQACAALSDTRTAEEYLQFHQYRKDAYADTHH
jgi:hypothetical protein